MCPPSFAAELPEHLKDLPRWRDPFLHSLLPRGRSVASTLMTYVLAAGQAFAMSAPSLYPVVDEKGQEVVLPKPQKIQYQDYIPMDAACVVLRTDATPAEQIGADDFCAMAQHLGGQRPPILRREVTAAYRTVIELDVKGPASPDMQRLPDARRKESYSIDVTRGAQQTRVRCAGGGPRGAYYAMQTLSQLLNRREGKVVLRGATISDWPAFEIRDLAAWARKGWDKGVSCADPEEVAASIDVMDFMARYKLNVYGTGYGVRWDVWPDRPGALALRQGTARIANHARDTGIVDYMQYAHLANVSKMDVTVEKTARALIDYLLFSLREGAGHVAVLTDDFVSLSKAEREKFGTTDLASNLVKQVQDTAPQKEQARLRDAVVLALAHADWIGRLQAEIRKEFSQATILYCPGYPHNYFGKVDDWRMKPTHIFAAHAPKDVGIIWTGLATWSMKIPREALTDWPKAMKGRRPFLWDNTIYSHWRGDGLGGVHLFSPYKVDFPADMPDLLYKGIHLNGGSGTGVSKIPKLMAITFACYTWNPSAYDPDASMDCGLRREVGHELAKLLIEFREARVDLAYFAVGKSGKRGKGSMSAEAAGELEKRVDALLAEIRSRCKDKELIEDIERAHASLPPRRKGGRR
jgi:hypothetical protein